MKKGDCGITTVYWIRHAESDTAVRDGRTRPLTPKGLEDRALVTRFLNGRRIGAVLSSPFRRAADTVAEFAAQNGLPVELVEDFRERKSDRWWDREHDFAAFLQRQWADFTYTLDEGECLLDVQRRNIAALRGVLARYPGQNIAIGTHGTALSTVIRYYDDSYGFAEYMDMLPRMPWAVVMHFDGENCAGMEKFDLFRPERHADNAESMPGADA